MKKAVVDDKKRIIIYSTNFNMIAFLIEQLKNSLIDINVQELGSIIDRHLLNELNECPVDLVLIDNNEAEKSLHLNRLIKEEGTTRDIPVVFYGGDDEKARVEAVSAGVLDVLQNPNTNESYLKLMNYIEIGKKVANSKTHDVLTGLFTRRAGEILLEESIFVAREGQKELAIAIMDIDNMEEINEAAGKRKGDEILKKFAYFIRHEIGVDGKNFAFRYSGKKFVMVLVNGTPYQALKSTLALQENFKGLRKEYNVNTSFSAGISTFNGEAEDKYVILNNALESQRAAKRDGKGRVYIHNSFASEKFRKNLLIAGADEVLKNILSRRYTNQGFRVLIAGEWEETVNALEVNDIDVLISDFESFMKLADYYKKGFRTENSSKVIVLSSSKIESTLEKAMNNGADEFIHKPFSIVELDLKLKKLLGQVI